MEFPKPTNRQTAKEKQRSRYETLIFTRLVLLVAVPLLIVGLLCGILYYRSEPARGRAKLGEVAGNASMRMTSVFDGLRSYYLAALRNSSFTWMESCSEIPYSRYSDLRDAQELLRGGTYMDSYVVGYEYINLRYGWVLSNYGTFPLEQMKNQEEIRTFIDNQASQTATLYWVNRTGAAPRQTSSLWLNVSGQCLVARITSAKNGLVGMLLIHLDMEYLSELAGEWKSLGYDVVLLDANGETVTTTDTELAHALADAGDLSDGHLRIPGTISNYLVQGQAINFNGITCYAAYDEQQNLGSSVAAFWVSVLILLATVVVLLVCRWNSAFLYLESPQERAQHQLHRPRRFPETRDGQGTAAHHRYVGGPGGRHAALLQRAELHPVLQPRGRHDPRQVQKRIPDGQEKALTARTPDGCSAGGIFLPRNANTSCGKKVCRRGLTK